MLNRSVAIIGAGLSGITCAKTLQGFIKNIQVFELEPHLGGRLIFNDQLATTSFFTVSTPFFQKIVDQWLDQQWIQHRSGWDVDINENGIFTQKSTQSEFQFNEQLPQFLSRFADGISIKFNSEISEIEKENNRWRLFDQMGDYLGQFDCVVFSSPEFHLIPEYSSLYQMSEKVLFNPCWQVIFEINGHLDIPYDTGLFCDDILLSFSYEKLTNSSRLSILANPEWSEIYSAMPQNSVIQTIIKQWNQLMDIEITNPISTEVKFWHRKSAISTLNEDCYFDDSLGIGLCGDFCTASRVEGAVISGFSMADRVMNYCSQYE